MKSIKNITLLAMFVVLGACSTVPETASKEELAFFDLIKGKSVYLTTDNILVGHFSNDGKTYIETGDKGGDAPFVKLSGNKAEYSILGILGYTFTTTAGETGELTIISLGVDFIKQDVLFK